MAKELPKCFKGTEHQGDYLIEIQRIETNHALGEDYVVHWCKECGAVVLDVEYDKRLHHTGGCMKFPNTLTDLLKE